jgi:hypothetical protein
LNRCKAKTLQKASNALNVLRAHVIWWDDKDYRTRLEAADELIRQGKKLREQIEESQDHPPGILRKHRSGPRVPWEAA